MNTMRRSSLLVYFVAVIGAASALSSSSSPPSSSSSSVTSSSSSSSISSSNSSGPSAAASSVVIRSHTLRGRRSIDEEGIGGHRESMTMHEIRPSPRDESDYEEDEVEQFYPTQRRAYSFPDISDPYRKTTDGDKKKVLNVRQTSFGCGRLGATVWPSSIALACLLAADPGLVEGRRVMELGSGCGLPSLVAKEVCGAGELLATDYWELPPKTDGDDDDDDDDDDDGKKVLLPIGNDKGDRLVPRDLFGANLAHNVGANDDDDDSVSVRRLDWHDEMGVFQIANDFRPEVIIGSDLVYYPMDTKPLLRTLEILLLGNGDGDGGCGGAREALLVSPLPPGADREALPEFRRMLMGEEGGIGALFGDAFDVDMDEMDMDDRRPVDEVGERLHGLLRIRIRRRR